MDAKPRVALAVDNTRTNAQRSKRENSSQSFLTDKCSIHGGKADVVRTQQSGSYRHFRIGIGDERRYIRRTLKTTHLGASRLDCENMGLHNSNT